LDYNGEITTRLFEHLNTRFYRTTAVSKYFTMIYGEISSGGKFRFISAGHPPPLVFSREFGRFVDIDPSHLTSFPPVGLLPTKDDLDEGADALLQSKRGYEVNQIKLLSPGDALLLATDGLVEHGGEGFFPTALETLLQAAIGESAEIICERIRELVLRHGKPEDDLTAVVVKRTN
jgi:serine phosphatase RsbU (regulator of sigma subunit)